MAKSITTYYQIIKCLLRDNRNLYGAITPTVNWYFEGCMPCVPETGHFGILGNEGRIRPLPGNKEHSFLNRDLIHHTPSTDFGFYKLFIPGHLNPAGLNFFLRLTKQAVFGENPRFPPPDYFIHYRALKSNQVWSPTRGL